MLQRVHDNGHVYKGIYEGWYCPRCADFKVENEILDGNRCPIHEIVLTREQEENWFFRLSSFQQPLEPLYEQRPDFVMPRAPLQRGARVHRSGPPGRLADPREPDVGGPGALGRRPRLLRVVRRAAQLLHRAQLRAPATRTAPATCVSRFWPATYHIIGKDILKFHTIFWPAMLMAADIPVPEHVFVHGFLLGADGRKMSKSLGNVLDPFEVIEQFGTDALRFYLMRDVAFGADGAVGMDAVKARYEAELANEYGNLASRTLAMLVRYRDGVVPAVERDPALAAEFAGLPEEVAALIDRAEPTLGARADLAARAPAEPLRRGAGALAARARSRPGQRARSDARLARRGSASGQRAAGAVHAGEHREAPRRARLARRFGLGASSRCSRSSPDRGDRAARRSRQTVIDSHTHLHSCREPDEELVAAASAAGVTRIVTVGTDPQTNRAALGAAARFEQVYAAVGVHPNEATGFDRGGPGRSAGDRRATAVRGDRRDRS